MGKMDWIDVAQDRDMLRTLVNAVTKFRFPQNAGNFVTDTRLASQKGRYSME